MADRLPTVIEGRDLIEHPLNPYYTDVESYRKTATVLAAQIHEPGAVTTPEGVMTFAAGDYIVSDDPPTHAWPVRREVFEATYVLTEDAR